MKNFRSIQFLVITAIVLTFFINSHAQKMAAGDIIAKHLQSIGSEADRGKVRNQLLLGTVRIEIKGSANKVEGKGLILSADEKNLWAMNLASVDYPQERFGFDGDNAKVDFARPGAYSDLGRFLYSYRELLREGLLGGTLSTSWALLDTDSRKSKISYEGTKKINGKETYVLSYSPKSGSDLSITMYFDKDNFQHVRTQYSRVVGARMGASIDTSASQGESRYNLTEDFSDFKLAGDLIIPSRYKLSYSYYSNSALQLKGSENREVELNFALTDFSFNNPIEAKSFEVAGK